jgi:hypothetical protein
MGFPLILQAEKLWKIFAYQSFSGWLPFLPTHFNGL